MTPYLQCGDIALYKPFKDRLSEAIESWKYGTELSYTKDGNPRQPPDDTVAKWARRAWNGLSPVNVKVGLEREGLTKRVNDWFLARHDLYSKKFVEQFEKACTDHNGMGEEAVASSANEDAWLDDESMMIDD